MAQDGGLGPEAAAVTAALEAVMAAMGLDDATLTLVRGDEESDLRATIEGPGTDALVGKGGETVDALQYLMGQIASRAAGGGRVRVAVDADGYRDRRARALRDLADRAASEALEHGEEIELEAMTPHDRRIVHMALKDRTDVITRSEGEEPRRRIVIEPAE